MAGGNAWHTYTSDDGNDYAMFADTSNATVVGDGLYTGTPPLRPLPKGYEPRGLVCKAANGSSRFIPLSTTALLGDHPVGSTIQLPNYAGTPPFNNVAFTVVQYRAERQRKQPSALNTGIG